MAEQLENKVTKLAVSTIQELLFSVNHQALSGNTEEVNFRINIDLKNEINAAKSEVALLIGIKYVSLDSNTLLLQAKVRNGFMISNLEDFYDEHANAIDIPLNLMGTLFGIAFSQTRAIIARNTSGTELGGFYLPVINPTEFLKNMQESQGG